MLKVDIACLHVYQNIQKLATVELIMQVVSNPMLETDNRWHYRTGFLLLSVSALIILNYGYSSKIFEWWQQEAATPLLAWVLFIHPGTTQLGGGGLHSSRDHTTGGGGGGVHTSREHNVAGWGNSYREHTVDGGGGVGVGAGKVQVLSQPGST
jgi:hypothetical protein